jgi:hypothetical protein
LEEDGLSSPRPTLEEAIKAVNAARQEGTAEYFRRISRLMCEHMQKQQWDKAMHPLDAASKANAAARERDRANEARARYRKRWQERGKTIAKLQARLSERQSGAVNASLRKWCRVVEDQRDVLKLQREEATSEAASLKKLVSTYGDRIAELHKANKQLDEGYNAAVLAVAEATNKRLEAEGERDAAIRERDNERLLRIETETYRDFARREKDAAIFHITELRAERDALQARVAELEAASGGGEGEPVAWEYDIQTPHGTGRGVSNLDPRKHPEVWQQGTGVPATDARPLYRSPPQPRGWLTNEEREAVEASREFWQVECDSTLGDDTDRRYLAALSNLLARSTPPEVRLVRHLNYFDCHGDRVDAFDAADVLAALVAAGVEVKEVQ